MPKEEPKSEEQDAKQEFLAGLAVSAETPVVEGATVRALADADCMNINVIAAHASLETKGDFEARRAAHDIAERAAILHFGVVNPKLSLPEWKHTLKTANTAKVEAIVAAIKSLSGMDQAEAAFAKKAAEQMGLTLQG